MDGDDYLAFDATGLAELVASGEVHPDELRQAATERHERTDPTIGAIVEWYDDPAPPVEGGPLWGVPFLRKDIGPTEAGRLTEAGSRLLAGWRPDVTSAFIERITAAGVQILGRSAVPEFAQHGTTESTATGPTRNPLDPTTSAGGSSGGAAAAVRAGVVPLAHASDAAGSIRIPASVTGLIGLKPTRHLVPPSELRWRELVVDFVVARSVRDVVASLDVVADPGRLAPADEPGSALRIALSTGHWAGYGDHPEVVAAVDRTARRLEERGHHLDVVERPFAYDQLMSTWFPLFGGGVVDAVEAAAAITGRPLDFAHLEPLTLELLDRVRALPPTALAEARRTAEAVTATLVAALDGFDVLVTPTLDRPTIPLGRMAINGPMDEYLADGDEWFDRLYVANTSGWPALSVPAPETTGPPIGIQLVAPPHHERRLLALAAELVDSPAPPVLVEGP